MSAPALLGKGCLSRPPDFVCLLWGPCGVVGLEPLACQYPWLEQRMGCSWGRPEPVLGILVCWCRRWYARLEAVTWCAVVGCREAGCFHADKHVCIYKVLVVSALVNLQPCLQVQGRWGAPLWAQAVTLGGVVGGGKPAALAWLCSRRWCDRSVQGTMPRHLHRALVCAFVQALHCRGSGVVAAGLCLHALALVPLRRHLTKGCGWSMLPVGVGHRAPSAVLTAHQVVATNARYLVGCSVGAPARGSRCNPAALGHHRWLIVLQHWLL
jgi:hypothetical protein